MLQAAPPEDYVLFREESAVVRMFDRFNNVSLSLYIYICIYMYMYVYVCICICVYIYIYSNTIILLLLLLLIITCYNNNNVRMFDRDGRPDLSIRFGAQDYLVLFYKSFHTYCLYIIVLFTFYIVLFGYFCFACILI